ncbi:hypothetical protein YB2330_002376 [Saitoella coloradoensis]
MTDPLPSSLPIIDISAWVNPSSHTSSSCLATSHALDSACRNHGFFYLSNHGLEHLTPQILHLARQFLTESSVEEKEKLKLRGAGKGGGDGARGYQRIGENVTKGKSDFHEALDLYRPWPEPTEPPYKPLQGPNQWPSHPPSFRETYEDYITQLQTLGRTLLRAMAVGLGEPESTFDTAISESFWVLRCIGYPPLTPSPSSDPEDGISCGEHTDYGCLTFLLTDDTKGALQVLHAPSGTWITADPIPGCFVVNIGDMFNVWTNGLYASTLHRVIHRGGNYRVSVPFFFEPGWGARIDVLPGCKERRGEVSEGQGKVSEGGVVYGEHLLGKVLGNFVLEDG